jgi:predicted nuclease of predicted toxin-antitoxin system
MTALLIDENVPPAISRFLRHRGFDIKEVHESYPGASDESLIELANREGRILVTFDRYFGDILRHPLSSHLGVIHIRIHPPLILDVTRAFDHFLAKFDLETMRASLVVFERDGFRIRRGDH